MTAARRRRGRRGLVFSGIGIAALAFAGAAFAFWASTDASNPAAAVADSIQAGNTPTLGGINGQDVTLNWTATTTASGASVSGYTINRYSVSSGGTPTAATGGCSGTVAALTCTEQSVPVGTWYYAVTPKISLWAGTESGRLSTSVVAASFSVTASQQVRATANVTGGSIAHFKNNETVVFHLDSAAGTTMTGSVSAVNSSGSASAFTVTVPAGTAEGSHTIVAVGGSGSQATSNSFNVDNTAPSGGSVTYTNGYFTTASVQVSFSNGIDTGGSGINTATTQLQRASATLTNGTCGTFGSFTSAGSAGQASPYTDTLVSSGNCYQYQYVVADNAGNSTTYTSANVAKVDTAAPTGGSVTYTNGYFTTASVQVTFSNGTDTASGINVATTQLQRASATLTNGTCGTFGSFASAGSAGQSSPYTDVSVSSGNCYEYQYVVADNAGNSTTYTIANVAKVDTTAPTGGSVTAATNANGYDTTASISVSFSNGTDTGGSGINTATAQLLRAQATLGGGTCGSFGSFTTVGSAGPTSPYADTSVVSGNCYEYQYVVADNAGNTTTYTSGVAKVDTTAPVFTITTSGANIYASGMTVLFKNTGTNTFTVTATDTESGISSSSFGTTPTGWTVSGSGNARTYTRSTANASSTLAVSATNGAGTVSSSTVTITFDNVKPVATDVTLANGGVAGTLDQADTVTITYSEQLNAASLCSAWNNSGVQTLNDATVTDANKAGGTLTVSTPSCTFNLGSVVPNAAYSSATSTFASSMLTWDPTAQTLTITIGNQTGGTVTPGTGSSTPKYTAAAAITDLVGNTITTTAINGSAPSRF
jgi:hypothetical protein